MSFFDDVELRFDVPSFTDDDPADDQRWSTWPASTPSERGPEPRPPWVVTAAAAMDTELGIVKTGKEADLWLIERAVPGDPTRAGVLAAKRYRSAEHSDFHRSTMYREGRQLRRSRDQRAAERGSAYGRQVAAGAWAASEFEALSRLWSAGIPVPYPVQLSGTELLMEFIGDAATGTAAPRLAQCTGTAHDLDDLAAQTVGLLHDLARIGFAHGDLSPYNLLVEGGRLVAIDVPQLVDLAGNPNGVAFLERDCRNVATWFTRRGVPMDDGVLLGELLAESW